MSKSYSFLLNLGLSLSQDEHVECLLGLGSMSETSRMDAFSDMDFFLIVERGYKQAYIDDLSWLALEPIVFKFKNTKDGYKVLFSNDVFAEYAVFEKEELPHIAFTKGQVIYTKPTFDLKWIEPENVPVNKSKSVDFLVNEALTNLYIGLKREHRGETASAFTFIQVYAAGLISELFEHVYTSKEILKDPFVSERRIENRYMEAFNILAMIKQGYTKNKTSALAALDFLNNHFDLNSAMFETIYRLTK